MPNFTYTRVRPVDLLEVATDQGGAITLSAAIAAIQSSAGRVNNCPQCVSGDVSTGYITVQSIKAICPLCSGYLKTTIQYMPDPNNQGVFIALLISGNLAIVVNATTQLAATVAGGAWSTSDGTTATVNAGLVTGVKAGTATITYTVNGYSATAIVTVTSNG